MKYIYNVLAQFAWGSLPIFVAYTQSQEVYKIFEKEYSTVILSATIVNSIIINIIVARLYRYDKFVTSLSELVLYLVALLSMSVYFQSWHIVVGSILLLTKGLAYAALEYRTETKRLFAIEAVAALCAIGMTYLLLSQYSNVGIIVLLILSTNILYIPILLSNINVNYQISWRSINALQIFSGAIEAIAITMINNVDRVIAASVEYNFYITSRISAAIFVIAASSLVLTINIMRIRYGLDKIKQYFTTILLILILAIFFSRLLIDNSGYISSGLAALVFTLCYFFLRQAYTDKQRLLVNFIFALSCSLSYGSLGYSKDWYALLLAVSMLSLLVWVKFKGKDE